LSIGNGNVHTLMAENKEIYYALEYVYKNTRNI